MVVTVLPVHGQQWQDRAPRWWSASESEWPRTRWFCPLQQGTQEAGKTFGPNNVMILSTASNTIPHQRQPKPLVFLMELWGRLFQTWFHSKMSGPSLLPRESVTFLSCCKITTSAPSTTLIFYWQREERISLGVPHPQELHPGQDWLTFPRAGFRREWESWPWRVQAFSWEASSANRRKGIRQVTDTSAAVMDSVFSPFIVAKGSLGSLIELELNGLNHNCDKLVLSRN